MAVYGVWRDKKAFGNLSIRQTLSDEACDGELGAGQRRPPVCFGLGGDEAPSDAELAQAAADAAGVRRRFQLRVDSEATAEGVDCGIAVGRSEFCAEVFECGRQLERSRRALEES